MSLQYITRQEAGEQLGVPVTVIDRLITTGALPRYRLRERYVRVRQADVDELKELPHEFLEGA
jgi:excisionase family DNA binding protein